MEIMLILNINSNEINLSQYVYIMLEGFASFNI